MNQNLTKRKNRDISPNGLFGSRLFKLPLLLLGLLCMLSVDSLRGQNASITPNKLDPFISGTFTGMVAAKTTVGTASVTNEGNAINASLTDFTTASVGGNVFTGNNFTLRVDDNTPDVYPVGTFVGFKYVKTGGLGNAAIEFKTYNGATVVQTVGESSFINMGGDIYGFYTTGAFDAVEFKATLNNNVTVANFNIYYAVVMRNDVAGAALGCNAPTILNLDGASPYPVKVINTGGTVDNPYFAINGSPSDVTTVAKVFLGADGKYSVRDLVTDYMATATAPIFVGFVSNGVNNLKLTPFLNGVAGTVVNSGDAKFTVINTPNGAAFGIMMETAFDELQVEVTSGSIDIKSFVVNKACATTNAPLLCNVAQILESGTDKALIVNGNRTTWDKISNAPNALTASADFTGIDPGALSVAKYSVKDLYNDYTPQAGKLGVFVGFDMKNGGVNILSLTGNVTIKTYLNGTLVETATNAQILEEDNANGRKNVGFRATLAFDEIQIELASGLNVTDSKEIYGLAIEQVCQSPELVACNAGISTPNTVVVPDYLVQIKSEGSLLGAGTVTDLSNVVSASATDFATMGSSTVGGNVSIVVKDKATTYPAGTFAGFEILSSEVVADSFRSLNFTTYLNGVKQEDTYVLNLGIIKNSQNSRAFRGVDTLTNRATVGILASKPFDEVKITYQHDNLLGLATWQPMKVYKAVLEKTCPATLTECNVPKPLTFPQYPVYEYSFMGGGCLTTILGEGALSTPNPNDYVTFVGGLSVGCTRFIGLKNAQGVPFPTESFVGFETETLTAVGLTVANVSFVETYLLGVKQESKTFVSVLNTTTVGGGRSIIGFKTDAAKPFDEIRFVKIGAADAEIGVTNIYNGFIQKTCPVDLVCNKPVYITTANATVTHDSYKTPLVSIYPINGIPQILPAAGCNGFLTNVNALITPDTTDFAAITNIQALGCSNWVEVRDWGTLYPVGTYIGVDLEQNSLVSLAAGDLRTVETYLDNNILPEEILVVSGGLASAGLLSAGRQTVGAVATKPFNRIRYSQTIALAVAQGVTTRIFGISALKPCAGAPLTCTTPNANPGTEGDFERLNNPPATNTHASTDKGRAMTLGTNPNDDILGVSVCSNLILNSQNAVSDDPDDYASITLTGVLCAASFTFNDLGDTFGAGHFVGVEIENTNFVSANLLGGITVETYLDGVKQETVSGLGLGALEIGSNGRRKIGFVNTKTFNSIKYFQGQILGVSLGVTKLYGAVVRKLCAGAPLVCNQKTIINAPNYPAGAVVGQSGGCASGVTNQHALSSNDTTDYATFTSGLNILCDRYVGIKDFATTYTAGTYAGFDVRFTAVVELALNQYKIQTWKNGVKQEESDAAFAVSYGLYAGNLRFPVGFKTTMDFDEIRFVVKSGASASLAGVDVFNAFAIKMCEPTLACNKTYNLTPSGATSFPIVVDGTKSGITGACLGCYVKNAENILSASTTDYAEIGMFLSALNEAKIAVKNPQTTYPLGTRVGFTYQNVNGIFDAALFNATTVRTFLNGVQQETKSATNLLEVPILTNWSAPAIKNIGFTTTMPFDEIQLAFSNTTGTFRVYGAFIDTRSSTGGSGALAACVCNAGDVAPTLTVTTKNNACPITTVDLSTITASNLSVGTTMTWHTDTVAVTANKVANPTLVAISGKYYAAFYDAVNGCYSLATTPVVVTAASCTPIFTFNCGSATSTGAFIANGTAGQAGTLMLPITGATAGSATFTVTGTGFTGTFSTLITAGQTSVNIPITYNGLGASGSRTLTVTSGQGIGTCTPSVNVIGASGSACLLSLPILLPIGLQLSLPNFCVRNGYNYYKVLATSTDELLAINPNGNTFNPTSVNVDVTTTGVHTLTSGSRTTALASRMASILASGSFTTNGGLKVRIYYNPTELASLPTNKRWFKHTAHTKAGVLADLSAGGLANATFLTPNSTGTENGVAYVEFTNITNFSTFGVLGTTAATFDFNCGTATSTGTFTANATAGQTGSLTIPLTNATAGDATFTVTGTGFTGTLTTTLTVGQTSVSIPIIYDGAGAVRTQMLTITSTEGSGSCTKDVSVISGITAPGCVFSGLDFWLDPSKNVTKTGTNVTGWNDADGNGNNPALTQATVALQPDYSAGDVLSNFNPYINFTANTRLHQTLTGANYSINQTTFGVVTKYAAKGSYNNFIRFTNEVNSDAGLHNWGLGTSDLGEDKVALHYIALPFTAVAPGNGYNRLNGTKLFALNTPTIMSASLNATTGATSVGNNGNEVLATGKNGNTFVPYNNLTVGGGNSYGMNNNKTQEIIHYSRELTIQERQRVQTYLAIKHGITLDNQDNSAAIVEGDYILGNGTTTVWNKTTHATYHNNVFGIGREDCQGLNQKQSKSVNTGFQPIIGLTRIDSTNAINPSLFSADASFLMMGSDAGAASFGTAITAPSGLIVNNRFTRIWKVQETGTVGTVKFAVPQVGSGGTVYLIRSTDATIDATDTWIPLSNYAIGGANYVAADVDFNNGDYFTIATYLTAPGCVVQGLTTWLKADFGTNTTTTGQDITSWQDASGNGNNHSKLSTSTLAVSPEFKTNSGFNFNPSVYFDGGFNSMGAPRFASGNDTLVVFTMSRVDNNTNWGALYSFSRDATHPQWYAGRPSVYLSAGYDPYLTNPAANLNILYGINTFNLKRAAGATNQDIWWNGAKTTYSGNGAYTYNATNSWMGNDGSNDGASSSEMFQGDIMETIIYKNANMTDAKIRQIQSYLGIKYGVTLSHNYVSGLGATIYDTTTFSKNIFGIGREDCQSLNQKQSKSVNPAFQPIFATTGFAATNAANSVGFGADNSYLIAGSDAGAASFGTAITAPTGSTANNRMTRIWKVQETGTIGTVKFAVPQVGTGGAVYLVRSTNTTFDANDTWIPLSNLTVGGTDYMAGDIDFANGDYFTIATFLTAPGCVANGLQYWFDAGSAVAGTTDVSAWADKFSGISLTKAASGTVGTIVKSNGDAQSNYNPFVTFPANAHITGIINPTTLGRLHTTFAVAQKDANIDATFNHAFRFGSGVGAFVTHDYGVGTHLSGAVHYPTHHWISKGTTVDRMNTASSIALGTVGIYGARINSIVSGNNKDVSFNGSTVTYSDAITGDINANMQIGGSGYGMQGRIPEVIYYNQPLTTNERERVDTYLGIKYGVSLYHNYYSGTSTLIYDTTGFSKNIFGIGREDCQSLNQKQSKSVNPTAKMTIGLQDSISTSNAAHPSVFSNDATFIVIGDNGLAGVITPSVSGSCPPPPSADKASAQKFKVVETGAVQSIKVLFNPSGLGFNNAFTVYMQVASDSLFTSLIANVPMIWSGANVTTNYNFASNTTSYVRFMGNTTSLANLCTANGSKTFYFNGWNYGTKTKDIVANYATTANAGDLIMKTTVTDGTPNVLLYRPNVDWYPVYDGYGLFFPRWGSSANENSTMTTKIEFLSQATTGAANASTTKLAAATASFMIWDLDGYIGSRDIVKVYGKLGSAVIDAKLTRNQYTALSLNYGGDPQSVIGGTAAWDLSYYGRLYVNFESPVEEIYIEYKQDATYAFNSYQDFRVGPITATCKAPTPKVVTPDNVYIYKEVASPVKSGDVATYKFTIQNTNCGDKTINFTDILPSGSGLIWADSSLSTPLSIGTKNAYGNSQTLTLSNVTVPAGTSYLFIDAKTSTVGTFNNQATFTVGANNYTTDDPTASGAGNQPTALTIIANDPDANLTIAKTVNKTTAGQNEVLTYTYVITNPNGTAVNATFDDQIPADASGNTVSFVASSLTGAGAALVSPYATTASLTIRNLSIPANGSTTLTIQANTGSFVLGDTIKNVASVVPDVSAGYRLTSRNSGSANTKIQVACSAGSAAPILSATTKSNTCPATTANLSTITASNLPVGTKLTWHTATPATFANRVADSTAVATAGTYYAAIYDFTNDCIAGSGAATTAVTVTITSPCAATFTFNCGGILTVGSFVANGTAGQTGSLTIPMTSATAGSATFAVTGAGFTGTLTTTLATGQPSVSVPITYDGTGAVRSQVLTIASSQGSGTCSTNVTVSAAGSGAPDLTTTIGQPTPVLTVGQPSDLPITVANIGNGAAPGIITTTITLPTGVTAPPTFMSNGWTCNTTTPSVICTNSGPIAAGANSIFNVPVTPDVTTVGTKPIFNGTTNPVTGETNTGNNNATPLTPTVSVQPANCNWTPGTIGK